MDFDELYFSTEFYVCHASVTFDTGKKNPSTAVLLYNDNNDKYCLYVFILILFYIVPSTVIREFRSRSRGEEELRHNPNSM